MLVQVVYMDMIDRVLDMSMYGQLELELELELELKLRLQMVMSM